MISLFFTDPPTLSLLFKSFEITLISSAEQSKPLIKVTGFPPLPLTL